MKKVVFFSVISVIIAGILVLTACQAPPASTPAPPKPSLQPFDALVSKAYLDKETGIVSLDIVVIKHTESDELSRYTVSSTDGVSFVFLFKFREKQAKVHGIPLSEQDSARFLSEYAVGYKEFLKANDVKENQRLFGDWQDKEAAAKNPDNWRQKVLRGKGNISFLDAQITSREEANRAKEKYQEKIRQIEELARAVQFPDFAGQSVNALSYIRVTQD